MVWCGGERGKEGVNVLRLITSVEMDLLYDYLHMDCLS